MTDIKKRPISIKIMIWAIMLVILLQVFNSITLISTEKIAITEDILFDAELYAEYNAEEVVDYYAEYNDTNHDRLLQLLEEILQYNNEIKGIYILNLKGEILVSPENLETGKALQKKEIIKDKEVLARVLSQERSIEIVEFEGEEHLDIIFPMEEEYSGELYIARFIFSFETLENEISLMRNQIIFIGILGGLIAIALIFFLSKRLTKPLKSLIENVRKISKGDLTTETTVVTNDEIGELSTAFNQMRVDLLENFDKLMETQRELEELNRSLEEKVEERTYELKEINEELKRISVTDKLTGLYNRVKLDETLDQEYDRFKRYERVFSVILLDIDHFKSVNDTYGHHVGDQVLVDTARILQNSIRKTDIIGRWGGEEFMIICPETDRAGAVELANKVRTTLEAHKFPSVGTKTASFGVSISSDQDTIDTLTTRADDALYDAKRNGRNRVEYR